MLRAMRKSGFNKLNINMDESVVTLKESNTLFPVFLKLEKMKLLIVGGGKVGLEKLNAVLSNSPSTEIKLIAITICSEIKQLALDNPTIQLVERAVQVDDLHSPNITAANNDRGNKNHPTNKSSSPSLSSVESSHCFLLCDHSVVHLVRVWPSVSLRLARSRPWLYSTASRQPHFLSSSCLTYSHASSLASRLLYLVVIVIHI